MRLHAAAAAAGLASLPSLSPSMVVTPGEGAQGEGRPRVTEQSATADPLFTQLSAYLGGGSSRPWATTSILIRQAG